MKAKNLISAFVMFICISANAQQVVRPPPASSLSNGGVISNWVMPVPNAAAVSAAGISRAMNFGQTDPQFRTAGDNSLILYFFCFVPGSPVSGPNGVPVCSDGGGPTVTGTAMVANPNGGGSN